MPVPAVIGLSADNIAMSTHPSAPKPLASATFGENSSMAQRSTASGEAPSNSEEIASQSLSVVSSPICSAAKAIIIFLNQHRGVEPGKTKNDPRNYTKQHEKS